jgi:hypothetical protein
MLVGAPSALAQGDGVTVDPNSPTGKQYKLPIESAREQANPKGDGNLVPPGARPAGTTAAPLFGAGITPASAHIASKTGRKQHAGAKSSPKASSTPMESSTSPLKAAIQNPGAPSGGVGAPLLFAGGAAVLLLLATLVGLLLRRRRTD